MKRILLSLATLFVLVLPARSAQASPLLYTFQGTVTSNNLWNPWVSCVARYSVGECASMATFQGPPGNLIAPGTPVGFGFLLDLAVDSPFYGDYDSASGPHIDGFFAEYLYGPSPFLNYNGTPRLVEGINVSSPGHEFYCGGLGYFAWPNECQMDMGFTLITRGSMPVNWIVGDSVYASDWMMYNTIAYDLTLTSIQPVPEPASLLLLGTGLVGLKVWRKRRQ